MSKKASVAKAKEELRTIFDRVLHTDVCREYVEMTGVRDGDTRCFRYYFDTNECEEVWLSDEEAEEDDDIFEGDDF